MLGSQSGLRQIGHRQAWVAPAEGPVPCSGTAPDRTDCAKPSSSSNETILAPGPRLLRNSNAARPSRNPSRVSRPCRLHVDEFAAAAAFYSEHDAPSASFTRILVNLGRSLVLRLTVAAS